MFHALTEATKEELKKKIEKAKRGLQQYINIVTDDFEGHQSLLAVFSKLTSQALQLDPDSWLESMSDEQLKEIDEIQMSLTDQIQKLEQEARITFNANVSPGPPFNMLRDIEYLES